MSHTSQRANKRTESTLLDLKQGILEQGVSKEELGAREEKRRGEMGGRELEDPVDFL